MSVQAYLDKEDKSQYATAYATVCHRKCRRFLEHSDFILATEYVLLLEAAVMCLMQM